MSEEGRMGDAVTFIDIPRGKPAYRPTAERVRDFRDVAVPREGPQTRLQAARCVECGVPFCQWRCPLGNRIPEWNGFLARGLWGQAYRALSATNNLPEITGRLCPALCESGCVLGIHWDAVTVREDELAIIERAFEQGDVVPQPPARRTGKSVAVVGSGPAGLSCADQLNHAGHRVVVFERDEKPGGLLRYGIPDFKLEKWVLDRRLAVWRAEGIEFETGIHVGVALPVLKLRRKFDAICLAGGCRLPRDLPIEGRSLKGIHVAMDYLTQANRRVAGEAVPPDALIDARGKRVVVIGGGDTGADCVGTAHRQGAARVTQIELLPRPPAQRGPGDRWPRDPMILRTSTSHEEGGVREWSVLTKQFLGAGGMVQKVSCVRVEFERSGARGSPPMREVPGSAFELEADVVLLAMGFVSPESDGVLGALGAARDPKGNLATDEQYQTSVPGVFAAGDMRRGQSLIVHAMADGRRAASCIDRFLTRA